MKTRTSVGTALGEFVENPLGHIIRRVTSGVSTFWTESALRMATHPDQWMLVYTYAPRNDRINATKDARSLAIGTQRRINNHAIKALKELRTSTMHFVSEVYTEDNATFCVYAKYTKIAND